MSNEGKLRRGKKWYNMRGQDSILPKDIAEDPNKMIDVDYFLENSKPVEPEPQPKKKGKK